MAWRRLYGLVPKFLERGAIDFEFDDITISYMEDIDAKGPDSKRVKLDGLAGVLSEDKTPKHILDVVGES